jgi:hypothetical protein
MPARQFEHLGNGLNAMQTHGLRSSSCNARLFFKHVFNLRRAGVSVFPYASKWTLATNREGRTVWAPKERSHA